MTESLVIGNILSLFVLLVRKMINNKQKTTINYWVTLVSSIINFSSYNPISENPMRVTGNGVNFFHPHKQRP
jgi:hypothetical protein